MWQWVRKHRGLPAEDSGVKVPAKCKHLLKRYLDLLRMTTLPGAKGQDSQEYKADRLTATDTDEFEDMGEPGAWAGEHDMDDDEEQGHDDM